MTTEFTPEAAQDTRGRTVISEKAVTKIITAAIKDVPGTASLESAFSRSYPRVDVQLDEDGDTMSADIIIAATWPSPIVSVAEKVRETVNTWVRKLTGIRPVRINVVVGPVETGDAVTEADLAAYSSEPTPTPVVAQPLNVRPITTRSTAPTVRVYTAAAPELTPIITRTSGPLTNVHTGTPVEVTSPSVPKKVVVRGAYAPKTFVATGVSISPNRFLDKAVTVARPIPLKSVNVFPVASHPGHVETPRPTPLKQVRATPVRVAHATYVAPRATQPVTVTPTVTPTSPKVPMARPLTPIGVQRRSLVPVTVARKNLTTVRAPRPIQPRPVTVTPTVGTLHTPRVAQRTIIIPTAPRARAEHTARTIDHEENAGGQQ